MSDIFFRDLAMSKPDVNLEVGSGTHAQQTAMVMSRIESVLVDFLPDLVMVAGDVNSTLGCAITAKKLGMRVAHIEAGLRSFDMTMPEEINRLCTDAVSDVLFTTDRIADQNLLREGVSPQRIHFVGNVMIDSLLSHREMAASRRYHEELRLRSGEFGVLTLHRPSNVDDPEKLDEILQALYEIAKAFPIIFPAHPRTRKRVEEMGLRGIACASDLSSGIHLIEPLGYIDFLSLTMNACLVLTDSGGLQEETTILGIPCVTLRDNTERPITVSEGTNRLGGTNGEGILAAAVEALDRRSNAGQIPEKWDGLAAHRIAAIVVSLKSGSPAKDE